MRTFSWRASGLLLLVASQVLGQVIYSDDFQRFSNGTVLIPTNYVPPVGSNAQCEISKGSGTMIASNFLGSIRAFYDCTAGSSMRYHAFPSNRLTNQILRIRWLAYDKTNSPQGNGAFGVLAPLTGSQPDWNMMLTLSDHGQVWTFTNTPSPTTAVQIGSWARFSGTIMTNELVLNYPAGRYSYALNGTVLTNMAIPPIYTNVIDQIDFEGSDKYSPVGNQFALDDITIELVQTMFTGIQVSAGTNIVIHFNTVLGSRYEVQTNSTLAPGGWGMLTNNIIGTGASVVITNTSTATTPQRFYRVKIAQ